MLRCIKAINPAHCCFTATDLEDSLAEIESILIEFNNLPKDESDPVQLHLYRESAKALLENAYALAWRCLSNSSRSTPDKQLTYLVADILRQYGQLCFHTNPLACKQLLLIAMNLQLYSVGIVHPPINLCPFHSLNEIVVHTVHKRHLFDFMHDVLLTTDHQQIVCASLNNCLLRTHAHQRLLALAQTARFLGLSYKNTSHGETTRWQLLSKQLFSLSESLLLLTDTTHSRRELAHLYFSTWPLFKASPYSDAPPPTLYEKTIAHHDTQEMQTRVLNKLFMIEMEKGNLEAARNYIEEAVSMANAMTPEERNPYLLSSIHSNYASFFLEDKYFDLQIAETYFRKACDFASQSRAAGEDRLYFAAYDERMAEVLYLLGDFKRAKKHIDSALATINKYPDTDQTLAAKAEALQSIIGKTLTAPCPPKSCKPPEPGLSVSSA